MAEQLACYVRDIPAGSVARVALTRPDGSDAPFAVVRTESEEFFVIDDTCTHAEVSLAEGELEGYHLECWAHGSRFDVRSGVPDELPAMTPVGTYSVRVDGDKVYADIDQPLHVTKENS